MKKKKKLQIQTNLKSLLDLRWTKSETMAKQQFRMVVAQQQKQQRTKLVAEAVTIGNRSSELALAAAED